MSHLKTSFTIEELCSRLEQYAHGISERQIIELRKLRLYEPIVSVTDGLAESNNG